MNRTLRWLTALSSVIVAFTVAWIVLRSVVEVDKSIAFAAASLLLVIASFPLAYWASRTILRAAPRPGRDQLVFGDIPRVAVGLQPRPHLIDELRRSAAENRNGIITAIVGMAGTGKTQLAAEYARQVIADGWPIVVWVHADSEDRLIDGLAALATRVGATGPGGDRADAARAALDWLGAQPDPGLLVYDGGDNPELIRKWRPPSGNTQTVITARRSLADESARVVRTDVFTHREAVAFLQHRTGLTDATGASGLAAELGYLPLALAQAAAVIGAGRPYATYTAYLAALGSKVSTEIERDAGPGYARSAARVIQRAIDEVLSQDSSGNSEILLKLLSVLPATGEKTGMLSGTHFDLAKALLLRYGLADESAQGNLVVHPLVQRVMLERLSRTSKLEIERQVESIPEPLLTRRDLADLMKNSAQAAHSIVELGRQLQQADARAGRQLVVGIVLGIPIGLMTSYLAFLLGWN